MSGATHISPRNLADSPSIHWIHRTSIVLKDWNYVLGVCIQWRLFAEIIPSRVSPLEGTVWRPYGAPQARP